MYYCESCKLLCTETRCIRCGKTPLRTIGPQDFCFFVECDETQAKMFKDLLEEETIPCALIPSGKGTRSALGLNLENMRIFLPYEYFAQGKELFALIAPAPLDETEDLRALLLENKARWHISGFFNKRSLPKKLGLSKNDDPIPVLEAILQSASTLRDAGLNSASTKGGHYLIAEAKQYALTFDSVSFELLHVKKKS